MRCEGIASLMPTPSPIASEWVPARDRPTSPGLQALRAPQWIAGILFFDPDPSFALQS